MKTLINLATALLIMIGIFSAYYFGRRTGRYEGMDVGWSYACDTIYKILEAQAKSDSTVTSIVTFDKDTVVYHIKRKCKIEKITQ